MESYPYTYSNLLAVYYDEGARCLKHRCYFAAIAILWAAADYAMEHQLRGGTLLTEDSLHYVRNPVKFNPCRFKKDKLPKFLRSFPELKEKWDGRLIEMYDLCRNTFLHGKLENIVESPLEDSEVSMLTVERGTNSVHQARLSSAEVSLIASAEQAANYMHVNVRDFLEDLNYQVNPRCDTHTPDLNSNNRPAN
jgi:hypothetical protein